MEGEKNKNSPLQSTCFIVYNGKMNPPTIYQFINESFQQISLTQYHRGFWLFSLNIDINSKKNIEFHISQPQNPTKFYIFVASSLSSFKFIDITQSDELISFSDFNSFFAAAIFNHKINFSFGSSNQLEDIDKFLSSFINYKSDQPLSVRIQKNNATSNSSNKNQPNNQNNDSTTINPDKKHKIDSSFYFSQDYNNNNFDKNDEYLIWALLYISCQPWYSLFQYNECFSKLLFKYISYFILNNFFLSKTETEQTDFKKCRSNLDVNFNSDFDFDFSINKRKLSSYQKFKSAQPFADSLILLIRAQLGEGIAYIVSCIFSKREEDERPITYSDLRFTLTSSVSSISSSLSVPSSALSAEGNPMARKRSSSFELRQIDDQISFQFTPSLYYNQTNHDSEDFILNELSKKIKNDEDRENLFLVYLAISTRSNKFTYKAPTLIDNEKVAKIICERLLFTSQTIEVSKTETEKDFNYFTSLIPNFNDVILLLSQGKYFIPFEWLLLFKKSPLFLKENVFISLVQNSLRNSTSKHLLNSYAKVTDSGAIYHDDVDLSNRVLQPGSILQPDVNCGKFSMMMAGSVALSGSVLIQNCYSPRNAIVLPSIEGTVSSKAIDETATIEMPVKLNRGVTIGKNSFVSKNVKIGSGTKIGNNVYVSENARIHKGCLIGDDELVPHNCELPIGFIYKGDVVEFAKKIPRVIRREKNSHFFYKQMNGFVDLKNILEVNRSTAFILDYFETFKAFPAECGRQIAMNYYFADECFNDVNENSLYGIFKLHSLILALEFWKTLDKQNPQSANVNSELKSNEMKNSNEKLNTNSNLNDKLNEISESVENGKANENSNIDANEDENKNANTENDLSLNNDAKSNSDENKDESVENEEDQKISFESVIFNLVSIAFEDLINTNSSSQLLTIDDFLEDEAVTQFALILAQNLPYFTEKGLPTEKVANVKKLLFELVDEVIVRMSLFANAERKRVYQVLKKIIELTQEKIEK